MHGIRYAQIKRALIGRTALYDYFSVTGKERENTVLAFFSLSTDIVPPCNSTSSFAMERPSPEPLANFFDSLVC